jgi:linoleoyl-CoA desaturase
MSQSPNRIAFSNNGNAFQSELRQRIDAYFTQNNISKTGNFLLWTKTFLALTIPPVLLAYSFLGGLPMWANYAIFAFIGVMHAFTGFNVMHDACHGSFSNTLWVNKLFGHSMELLGSSAHIWKFKHNVLHHTWTNVDGIDDDIAKSPMLRHCNSQAYKPIQKYQHVYMFLLYGISTIWWMFGNDLIKYFKKEVNAQPMPKMSTVDHLIFWGFKLLYAVTYVVLPIAFFGVLHGILLFVTLHFALGLLLSLVFQMAHAVEGVHFEDFNEYDAPQEKIPNEWAIHQVLTTNNFATKSWLATFFMGGLNFQVEHHLFPNISHVHYPKMNEILKELCVKYNIQYNEIPTFWQSVVSHIRWMKAMGTPQLQAA